MNTQKTSVIKMLFALGITLNFSFVPRILLAQIAQISSNHDNLSEIHFNPPPPPPKRGTPFSEEGTGSRGNCLYKKDLPPLTRLVGSAKLQLTVKEHPEFWVYLPYTAKEAPEGTFSLQDKDDDIYRTSFNLPATPGIIKISLPANLPPLEIDKKYRWYVDIKCPSINSAEESTTSAFLTGFVTRIQPSNSLNTALQTASTPLELIAAYAENGIWYEVFNELALIRQQEPNNSQIEQIWLSLLSDENVNLARVASQPIIGRITPDSE